MPGHIHRASIVPIGALLLFAASEESLTLAKRYLAEQEFPKALLAVDAVLAQSPADLKALKLKADIHYLLGEDHRAEQTILSALRIHPDHEDLIYALGRVYSQQDRYVSAIQQFEKVVQLQPKSYKAYDNLGLCYEHLNQPERAIRNYLKAIELVHKDVPAYSWPYANLANLLLNQGDFRQAFNLATEAAERDPDSARNFYLAGKALIRLKQEEKSLRWLRRSMELDPEYPEPHYLLAQVLRRQGKPAEADQEFARFKELRA
ncbi:MAG: tetratricopeptide repeat protein, partial [Bryobacteraceae bacterium]|nr:tetratricopeptide repeat protein [Bryobacteraceae bacterium]